MRNIRDIDIFSKETAGRLLDSEKGRWYLSLGAIAMLVFVTDFSVVIGEASLKNSNGTAEVHTTAPLAFGCTALLLTIPDSSKKNEVVLTAQIALPGAHLDGVIFNYGDGSQNETVAETHDQTQVFSIHSYALQSSSTLESSPIKASATLTAHYEGTTFISPACTTNVSAVIG